MFVNIYLINTVGETSVDRTVYTFNREVIAQITGCDLYICFVKKRSIIEIYDADPYTLSVVNACADYEMIIIRIRNEIIGADVKSAGQGIPLIILQKAVIGSEICTAIRYSIDSVSDHSDMSIILKRIE